MASVHSEQGEQRIPVRQLEVTLNSDAFFKRLITEMTRTLEDVVGTEEASGLISLVGNSIGRQINQDYAAHLPDKDISFSIIPEILVDLKRRIGGEFRVQSLSSERIVLVNTQCPFGKDVVGKPSLCMMTSNVFGRVVADNLGYARVLLDETIASGADACCITIELAPAHQQDEGREDYADPVL